MSHNFIPEEHWDWGVQLIIDPLHISLKTSSGGIFPFRPQDNFSSLWGRCDHTPSITYIIETPEYNMWLVSEACNNYTSLDKIIVCLCLHARLRIYTRQNQELNDNVALYACTCKSNSPRSKSGRGPSIPKATHYDANFSYTKWVIIPNIFIR